MKRLQKKIAKQKTSENSGQKQTRSSGYVLIAAVISGLVIAMAGAAVIGFLIMMLGSFISALIAFSSLIKQKQAGNKDKKLKGNTNLLMGTAFVIALLAAGGLIAALVTDAIKEFFWWCC